MKLTSKGYEVKFIKRGELKAKEEKRAFWTEKREKS